MQVTPRRHAAHPPAIPLEVEDPAVGPDFDKEVERQTVRFLKHLKLVQCEREIYEREEVAISFNFFRRLAAMAPDLARRVAERVRESITLSEEQPA